jgi:hypothetical protein
LSVSITDQPGVQMGLPRDEGLVVAYIPRTAQMPEEYEWRDGMRFFVAVAYDDVLMDLLPSDNKNVKWWKVREAARDLKLDEINPIWSGPSEDFRVSCLPQVPQPDGTVLAMRQYSRGPWITLEEPKPGEQLSLPFESQPVAQPYAG